MNCNPDRKIKVIMFTDMAGFSLKMSKDEHKTILILEQHNKILEPIIREHGGQIVKHIGDAIMGVFCDCSSAFNAGILSQEALRVYNLGKDTDDRIDVRIGIHVGEVLELNDDFLGHAVNIAARIEPLAKAGDVLCSKQTKDIASPSSEIEFSFVNEVNVRNISDPVVIYKIMQREKEENSKRVLIIFAGPSAVGKDVVASYCRENLIADPRFGNCKYLIKYSTRELRGYKKSDIFDAEYEPESVVEYKKAVKEVTHNPDNFFPYEKYGNNYGFSLDDLVDTSFRNTVLMCVFNRLERLKEFKNKVEQLSKRAVYIIYLKAPEEQLRKRQRRRQYKTKQERDDRTIEMEFDIVRFKKNVGDCRDCVNMIISNGNNNALNTTVFKATKAIKEFIQQ